MFGGPSGGRGIPTPTPTPIGTIWIPFFFYYGGSGGTIESVHSKIVSYAYVESEIYYDDVP